ncbi:uncharacterized protein RHO25_002774 [Cercospora beticola]|uniref:Uncharacterized protein n=1 Tax=Cercospora beticola TaxID=122368 RepID=A0ABZ0NF69_CERBT|nr:hypothetical protein RHO25_002774 [Cercospora beticola]
MASSTAPTRKPPLSSLKPSSQDASPFFSLPGELRNRIYRLVLVEEHDVLVSHTGYTRSGLLGVCQQIAAEATAIYYEENIFQSVVTDYDSQVMYALCRHLTAMKQRGLSVRVQATFCLNSWSPTPNWNNLMTWIKRYFLREVTCGMIWGHNATHLLMRDEITFYTIGAMFSTARALTDQVSWDTVEKALETNRQTLIHIDPAWRDD